MPRYKITAEPVDIIYVYDGSPAGFYSCVHESIYNKELPLNIVSENEFQPSLFGQKHIQTNQEAAEKVMDSIIRNISAKTAEIVSNVLLCHHENKEMLLLEFIIKSFREGPKVSYMMGDSLVSQILDIEKSLLIERHMYLGFVRFQDYGNILGSVISPKNFVLPLLAEHFIDRFPNENFIIYDKSHKAALIYQDKKLELTVVEEIEFQPETENEKYYQSLWKTFYNTIGIKERINPKCRMTHMPKRYWENMVEMKELL